LNKYKFPVPKQRVIGRIRKEFPFLAWKRYRLIDRGWDHFVIVLDGKIVFRTPKDVRYRRELKNEIGLLSYLKKKVKVGIPDYKYVCLDRTLAGYDLVPGRELTVARFRGLTAREKGTAARQLARFITALHSTPRSVLKKYHVQRDDPRKRWSKYARDMKRMLYPRMRRAESDAVTRFLDEQKRESARRIPFSLVHRDISGVHILWEKKERRINIIDFSDRVDSDPAYDFVGLFEYGFEFARKVFRLYRGPKDDRMLYRASLYHKSMPLLYMMASLRGDPCSFRKNYDLFRQNFMSRPGRAP
jgi:aminoglycoside phosphotransferase (APT) family kinase protein